MKIDNNHDLEPKRLDVDEDAIDFSLLGPVTGLDAYGLAIFVGDDEDEISEDELLGLDDATWVNETPSSPQHEWKPLWNDKPFEMVKDDDLPFI